MHVVGRQISYLHACMCVCVCVCVCVCACACVEGSGYKVTLTFWWFQRLFHAIRGAGGSQCKPPFRTMAPIIWGAARPLARERKICSQRNNT